MLPTPLSGSCHRLATSIPKTLHLRSGKCLRNAHKPISIKSSSEMGGIGRDCCCRHFLRVSGLCVGDDNTRRAQKVKEVDIPATGDRKRPSPRPSPTVRASSRSSSHNPPSLAAVLATHSHLNTYVTLQGSPTPCAISFTRTHFISQMSTHQPHSQTRRTSTTPRVPWHNPVPR